MSAPTPWRGGPITRHATCVLAPNPGPMTLEGTNTWVLMAPEATEAVVIDPGPQDEGHLQAVCRLVAARGARVRETILTHAHLDHAAGAPRFGHTADSLSFVLEADHALLAGDTVLGRGTTVVAHPDGELASYFESLERLQALTGPGAVTTILPGHGPVIPDARAMIGVYRQHRRDRLEQVRQALADGAQDVEDVLRRVYAEVPREVWPAARLSIAAQLDYLARS